MKPFDWVLFAWLLICLTQLGGGGGVLPEPPVESPFPAEGPWMLIVHDSETDTAVRNASQAEYLREFFGDERLRVEDDTEPPRDKPWSGAFSKLRELHPSGPAYLSRHGSRTPSGALPGSIADVDRTLRATVEGLR